MIFGLQLGNHPLLIRRLYSDDTVKRLAKKFHPLGVFGYECDLQRVEDELSSYSDFSLHKVWKLYVNSCGPVILAFLSSEGFVMTSVPVTLIYTDKYNFDVVVYRIWWRCWMPREAWR